MKPSRWLLVAVFTMGIGFEVTAEEVIAPARDGSPKVAKSEATSVDEQAAALSTIRGTITIDPAGALVQPNGSDAVAYLASHPGLDPPDAVAALEQEPPPISERPHIIQHNRAFSPELLVIQQFTHVEFPNWDQFNHNVFSRSAAAPPFDLERYPYGQSKSYQFIRTGVVQVFCNIHPNMRATVFVTPNRYFVQADDDGRFTLAQVPPGKYELVVWHPRCADVRRPVEVEAGQTVDLSIALERAPAQVARTEQRRSRRSDGLTRGLAVERERLDVPVVQEAHAACELSNPARPTNEEPDLDESAQ